MKLHIMTWNTQLYEYGNILNQKKPVKPMDYIKCNDVFKVLKKHIDEKENAIAVLQEIPFHNNITNSEHIIFTLLCGAFPEKDYTILYNLNEMVRNQIKMTVVISKRNFIKKDEKGINSSNEGYCNCFVSFLVDNLKVLAVHQSLKEGGSLKNKIKDYWPDIILGDFNAGDYKKTNESDAFKKNRKEYRALLNSKPYVDICAGQPTTKYDTSIDHVLVSNDKVKNCSELNIINEIELSDHYPITFDYEID